MSIIQVRGLTKSFESPVLTGVDLDVRPGEVLVVLGSSGSGKSVFLKCVTGLMEADGGSIVMMGEEIIGRPEPELLKIRRKTGILFQGGALFDSMSVFDNIAFGFREALPGIHQVTVDEKVKRMLHLVHMPHIENKMPAELSGGMQKRVALARAIALEPEIIFYDEPTTGLDPVTARSIGALILDMNQQLGITSVVVSHDIELAFTIADRIALLKDGQVAYQGTPVDMQHCDQPSVCEFLGSFYRERVRLNNHEKKPGPEGGRIT